MSSYSKISIGFLALAAVLQLILFVEPATFGFLTDTLPVLSIVLLIAAVFFHFKSNRVQAASNGWQIDANIIHVPFFKSDLNGKLLGANTACRELLDCDGSAQNVVEFLEPLHKRLLERQQADEVLQAVISAPDINFSDRLNLSDGRIIERITRPIEGSNERIWILRDLTQVLNANSDSQMHQTMLEEDAARTAELAEQLYLAKAELEEKQAELTRLANTDPMTGLWNRRRFLTLGEEAIEQTRENNTLWVVMMDIDHFKRINDTYGHAAGDVAIRDFAQLIHEVVGDNGFVGRMGGEEFAAILCECPVDQAYRMAERIRKGTTQIQTECDAEVFRFTTSIGVAAWIKGELSIEPALDRADKALYSAKSYGRNRVVGYE